MSVGYLPHSFDLLNVRDLDFIAQAKHLCSHLVVGVFSDDFVERLLGRRPVVPMNERMTLVSHVRGVDQVVVHDDETTAPDHDLSFSVAGNVPLLGVGETWLLSPGRETSSAVLRAALQPVEQQQNVA